ncbi:hypothetical protein [Agrobacterium tumefaciens]|jgi:hypothetical protein|uniref:hypothetical protein n=1 Tax=Agrobacterium tumefaciens TaxID=358 RepID=UPI000DCFE958|nr:hypothetical protein [Agrobacterium tumefaciens]UXT00102.1 hypothetical protein FY143_25215 [Agrobacterium tumefaciens]WCK68890.1 hypothetical protein G6L23_026160 [Agrobacterium tumefaciens]
MRDQQGDERNKQSNWQKRNESPEDPQLFQVPDFELYRHENGGWRIFAVSDRGIRWIAANFDEWNSGEMLLSLQQANSFLREARKSSLCTSYKGPNGRTVI